MKRSTKIFAGVIAMVTAVVLPSCCCHNHMCDSRPACDTYVDTLPVGYRKAIYGGTVYYTYDNVFYRPHFHGWKVVPDPGR